MAIARPGGSPRICLWTRYTGMQTAKKLSGIVTIHINTAQSASNQRLSIAMRSAADRGWMGGSSLCGGIAAGTRPRR